MDCLFYYLTIAGLSMVGIVTVIYVRSKEEDKSTTAGMRYNTTRMVLDIILCFVMLNLYSNFRLPAGMLRNIVEILGWSLCLTSWADIVLCWDMRKTYKKQLKERKTTSGDSRKCSL